MIHSITWIQLSEKEWLVICVNCGGQIPIGKRRELASKGIKTQEEHRETCSEYLVYEYKIRKNGTITNEEKEMIESLMTKY